MTRQRRLKPVDTTPKKPATLAEMMQIGLIMHEDGKIWLFHNKAFPSELQWVEYDGDENTVSFICKGGLAIDLGMPLTPEMSEEWRHAEYMMTSHVEGDVVKGMSLVSVATRKIKLEEETTKPQ